MGWNQTRKTPHVPRRERRGGRKDAVLARWRRVQSEPAERSVFRHGFLLDRADSHATRSAVTWEQKATSRRAWRLLQARRGRQPWSAFRRAARDPKWREHRVARWSDFRLLTDPDAVSPRGRRCQWPPKASPIVVIESAPPWGVGVWVVWGSSDPRQKRGFTAPALVVPKTTLTFAARPTGLWRSDHYPGAGGHRRSLARAAQSVNGVTSKIGIV